MRDFIEALAGHARRAPDAPLFSDAGGTLSRAGLLGEAAALAARLPRKARVVGLLLPNGRGFAVAQLACVLGGRIAVPLPTFFSPSQLDHVMRDAGVDLVLTNEAGRISALPCLPVVLSAAGVADGVKVGEVEAHSGFGQIIYTSGSSGQPKGVRHESGQIGWSACALATAIAAQDGDSYLSVLPLPLLLETICAVFVPALVGGRCHFETELAEAVGRGAAAGIAAAFASHRPSVGVVVPELLRVWVGELMAAGAMAPSSLRFVAAGGAAVPPGLAAAAWRLGIPVHEGYGLSECCSVVALNRPGARTPGTVGVPLPGVSVTLRDGEILVDGPSVTDGYLGGPVARRPWATGDLGAMDANGVLTVFGRKDNLIVTAFGRNVSPEWVETALLEDPAVAFCAVVADGAGLAALVVPSPAAADLPLAELEARVAACCAALPAYARPGRVERVALSAARSLGLLTDNGRVRRPVAQRLMEAAAADPRLTSDALEERLTP